MTPVAADLLDLLRRIRRCDELGWQREKAAEAERATGRTANHAAYRLRRERRHVRWVTHPLSRVLLGAVGRYQAVHDKEVAELDAAVGRALRAGVAHDEASTHRQLLAPTDFERDARRILTQMTKADVDSLDLTATSRRALGQLTHQARSEHVYYTLNPLFIAFRQVLESEEVEPGLLDRLHASEPEARQIIDFGTRPMSPLTDHLEGVLDPARSPTATERLHAEKRLGHLEKALTGTLGTALVQGLRELVDVVPGAS